VRRQLDEMFSLFETHTNLQLKLHAWEKPAEHAGLSHFDGKFYTVFKNSLAKRLGTERRVIRIGHIGGIDPRKDPEYFKSLGKKTNTDFIFEANIRSSMGNHDVKIADLVSILDHLAADNFEIVLGTDGAGILTQQDPHYEATLKFLKANGLKDTTLAKITHATEKYSSKSDLVCP
jgi:hypothetical protein